METWLRGLKQQVANLCPFTGARGFESHRLRMRIEQHKEYISGFEAEEALLGQKLDWEKILQKHEITAEKRPFQAWQQILENVYPENPFMPAKKWGKDLYDAVAKKLEIDVDTDDTKNLRFYKTLGTDLDRMGIDCFFTLTNPQTKRETSFTIDLTTRPQKDEYKADITVQANEIPNHRTNETEYIKYMENLAEIIAKELKNKTEIKIH